MSIGRKSEIRAWKKIWENIIWNENLKRWKEKKEWDFPMSK